MGKNYVVDKDMERKDEKETNKSYEINEKRRTGYNDDGSPSMNEKEQQLPGDEIVEDLREMSRQQGQKDGDPAFLNGENVQQEPDRPRYGDSISETADKEYRKEDEDSSSEWQNKRN